MTQTLGTNSNNDLYRGPDGNLVMLTGEQAVGAACKSASLAQLGEMVLATNAGLPNFEAIWVGTPNLALWKQYLLNTLLGVKGVLAVTEIAALVVDGVLTYTATIKTEYGEVATNGGIPIS